MKFNGKDMNKLILFTLFLLILMIAACQRNDVSSVSDKQSDYIGCWNGMGGGRVKIVSSKIYDLGSKEESHYKERSTSKKIVNKGLQTGKRYLLESDDDFPDSFLARLIELSYNSDGTVGISSYDSYDDYLKDNFMGQGLFEKVICK